MTALVGLCGCVAPPKPVIPPVEGAGPASIVIVPTMAQDAVAIDFESRTTLTVLGGVSSPAGLVVGAGLDSLLSIWRLRYLERTTGPIAAAFAGSDPAAHFQSLIDPLPDLVPGADVTVRELRATDDPARIARDILTESGADAVIVIDAAYRISQAGNQFIVTLLQRTYTPGRLYGPSQRVMQSRHLVRRYTYLSPQHALVRRPFRPGEKARYRDDIMASYADLLDSAADTEPLRAARDEELAELEAADTVPIETAVAEIWTPERVDDYLRQAREHLRAMLAMDWQYEGMRLDRASRESVRIVEGKGAAERLTVFPIRETATHRIVREPDYGNLFAIPIAPETGVDDKRTAGEATDRDRRRPCLVSTACRP